MRQITLNFDPGPEFNDQAVENLISAVWMAAQEEGARPMYARVKPHVGQTEPDVHHECWGGTLMIDQLKEILEGLPTNRYVVFADPGEGTDRYWNVGEVVVPGRDPETAEFVAVTLFKGEPFDSRQL
jgi:hypothetical protein